jgi:hypothetical protein
MEPDLKSEEQRHYDSLIRFFKYLVTLTIAAITIVVGVVMFLTFQNMSDARQEVTKSLTEIKTDVKDATEKSLRSFDKLQIQVREEVKNFKEETRGYALNETKLRVAEAFEENKIKQLIEITAEERLKEKLEAIVEEQLIIIKQRVENQMKIFPDIVLAVDKIRNGKRAGLYQLDSLRLFSKDPLIRDLANDTYREKARDYEEFWWEYSKSKSLKDYRDIFRIDTSITVNDTILLLQSLITLIQTDQELNNVAYAICVFNNLTGQNIEMFDFEKINVWARKNDLLK